MPPRWPFDRVHSSFTEVPVPNGKRSDKESGRSRQERFDINTMYRLSCNWQFLPEVHPYLRSWVENKISGGFAPFRIILPLNFNLNYLATATAINGIWRSTYAPSGNLWVVSSTLEIDNSHVVSEADLDVWLATQ